MAFCHVFALSNLSDCSYKTPYTNSMMRRVLNARNTKQGNFESFPTVDLNLYCVHHSGAPTLRE
jgi:hypothetical protein